MTQASQAKYDLINGPSGSIPDMAPPEQVLDTAAAHAQGKTMAEAYAASNPNAIPVDQFLAARAGRSGRTALGQGYQDYIAAPATQALGTGFQAATSPLTSLMNATSPQGTPQMPGLSQQQGQSLASFVVPQDLTSAAVTASLPFSGGMGLLGRLGLSGAAGLVGGLADRGTGTGAALGAAQGLASRGMAEAAAGGGALAKDMWTGGKDAVNTWRSGQMGNALQGIPRLQGVFGQTQGSSPAQLYELAHGVQQVQGPNGPRVVQTGENLLSQRMEQAGQQIKDIVKAAADKPVFPDPLAKPNANPAGSLPDWLKNASPERLAEIKAANPSSFPDESQGSNFVTWDEARTNLSKLIKKANMATGTDKYDLMQQVEESKRLITRQLSQYDPTGRAAQIFADSSAAYRAGMFTLEALRSGFAAGGEAADKIQWNSNAVQRFLNQNNKEAGQALGVDGLDQLRAIFPAGRVDTASSGHGARLVERAGASVPGLGRVTGYLGGGLGSTSYAGPTPLDLSPVMRQGLQLGAGQGTNATLDRFTRDLMLQGTGR